MLSFHPLSLADKQWIDDICALESSRSADFSFVNMFLWDEKYRQQVCRFGDRLLVLTRSPHGIIFPFPIGGGELAPALAALMDYAREKGFVCVFRGVEQRHLRELETLFPDRFFFCHDRDYDDYLYSAEKLSTLSGKKNARQAQPHKPLPRKIQLDFSPHDGGGQARLHGASGLLGRGLRVQRGYSGGKAGH